MISRSIAAQQAARFEAFRDRVEALGGTVLETEWLGSKVKHRVRCAKGHACTPIPNSVQQGRGLCRVCAGKDPITAEAAFKARLNELGATLLEPKYLGSAKKHHVRCKAGHDCFPAPTSVQCGNGICNTCANAKRGTGQSAPAEAAFRARLVELDATLLEPTWRGALKPHHVRCAAGHDCYPRPAGVQQGQGICKPCGYQARVDPRVASAYAAFQVRLAELGATLLETEWLGAMTPHHVRCAAGHDCYPHPANVMQGQGICRACVGLDPDVASAEFRSKLKELGATLLDTEWRGNKARYRVRCPDGHYCYPMPNSVQQGRGICDTCAGKNATVIFEAFKLAVLAQDGDVLEFEYRGSHNPHHVRCSEGHDCYPTPHSIQQKNGICRICARVDPATSEAEFRRRVKDLGGEVLGVYINSNTPCHVRCAQGHECYPRPGGVGQGQGICLQCRGRIWDVFYVVAGRHSFKFGITSGSPKSRLAGHRRDGYDVDPPLRLFTGLASAVARSLEVKVLKDLATNGYKPVMRREYFGIDALPLVLCIVDDFFEKAVD